MSFNAREGFSSMIVFLSTARLKFITSAELKARIENKLVKLLLMITIDSNAINDFVKLTRTSGNFSIIDFWTFLALLSPVFLYSTFLQKWISFFFHTRFLSILSSLRFLDDVLLMKNVVYHKRWLYN